MLRGRRTHRPVCDERHVGRHPDPRNVRIMLHAPVDPVNEHLPKGEPRGCVLVVSDNRLINLSHAAALSAAGYAVYTAVTCTDVPRVFERFSTGNVDLIVFASLVHGWHHLEAERRPDDIPAETDARWQMRNIVQVVDAVCSRQDRPPRVLVATDLISHDCYNISRDALNAAGVDVNTYSASNPPSIIGFLQ